MVRTSNPQCREWSYVDLTMFFLSHYLFRKYLNIVLYVNATYNSLPILFMFGGFIGKRQNACVYVGEGLKALVT